MTTWTTVHKETHDGFDIDLSITPELMDPRGHFDDSLIDDVLQGIENGSYEWFTARAQASRHGVPLGETYLGGCLYVDAREFVADEYWRAMVNEAINEARGKFALLLSDYK